MIVGIGIDLVSIEDLMEKVKRPAFINKVFTENEVAYCQSYRSPIEHFAGKFAAKEAFMKAIGKGIQQGIWFKQIEIANEPTGAPSFNLYRQALSRVDELKIGKIHVSISHSKDHAVAIVILETND
ncbi:MAG: holo-ACP synthase [Anaerolineales bacterium]|jgi:holo-[acyl-carrier protein] synthase